MPLIKTDPFETADRLRRSWRKCAVLLALAIVAGCWGGDQPGVVEPVEGYFGGVAADEPRAAIAGRDILVAGGSAADAAVATALTLAVTLPGSAGLGGGGACVVHDGASQTATLVDFRALPPVGGTLSVPSLVRGLALINARHGRMQWSQLVSPAESAARFGALVSRALARDLAEAPRSLVEDPATARVFAPGGTVIKEGDTLLQIELAAILGQIRQRGGGDLYVGPLARVVAEASNGAIPVEAIRGYLPQAATPPAVRFGDILLYLAGAGSLDTALASRLLAIGVDIEPGAADAPRVWAEGESLVNASVAERLGGGGADLVPSRDEARALVQRARSGPHQAPARHLGPIGTASAGATAFAVTDRRNQSVACALGLNAPWGSGRVLPGTGILGAPPPSVDGPRAVALVAAVPSNGNTYLVASGSGRAGPVALAQIAVEAISDRTRQPELGSLLVRPRIAFDPATDTARVEPGLPTEGLARAGFKTAETSPLGQINIYYCPLDMGRGRNSCQVGTDPRGAGLAFGSGRQPVQPSDPIRRR
jgi:gamma-glutamyltranspeptidase/glutathione hydrolase